MPTVGHDAAMFARAGIPLAVLLVRNANGSHNSDEALDPKDFARRRSRSRSRHASAPLRRKTGMVPQPTKKTVKRRGILPEEAISIGLGMAGKHAVERADKRVVVDPQSGNGEIAREDASSMPKIAIASMTTRRFDS